MKILIIKPSSFGDIIQALPCAAALKQIYPESNISWVVFDLWSELLQLSDDVDNIIVWKRKEGIKGFIKTLKQVRKENYDLIIDLQGLLRSAFLAKFAKAKIKIGVPGMKEFSNLLIKEVYPQKAKMNATLRNLEPIKFLLGNKSFDVKVNLKEIKKVNIKLPKKYIVLLAFARGKGKDWGIKNYETLIKLIKKNYPSMGILTLGSAKDKGKFKSKHIIDLCGQTDMLQLAYIISKAKLAIGADTGPMHLAAILNTPSIFIFGNSDITETSPYIGNFAIISNKKNQKEIEKITANEVFSYVKRYLK